MGVLRWFMIPCRLLLPLWKFRTPIPHNVYYLPITAAGLTGYWMTDLSCLDDCSRRSSHTDWPSHTMPWPTQAAFSQRCPFQEKGLWERSKGRLTPVVAAHGPADVARAGLFHAMRKRNTIRPKAIMAAHDNANIDVNGSCRRKRGLPGGRSPCSP